MRQTLESREEFPPTTAPEALIDDDVAASGDESEVVSYELAKARNEHADLDKRIKRLQASPSADPLEIRRLKKERLLRKDTIARLRGNST